MCGDRGERDEQVETSFSDEMSRIFPVRLWRTGRREFQPQPGNGGREVAKQGCSFGKSPEVTEQKL